MCKIRYNGKMYSIEPTPCEDTVSLFLLGRCTQILGEFETVQEAAEYIASIPVRYGLVELKTA